MSSLEVPPGWPKLEVEGYYGLVGEMVDLIGPQTEADPAALVVDALAIFGSCVGPGPHALADGAEHPGRLFVAIVGDTSRGRKDTALRRARAPFAAADPHWSKDCGVSGLGSGEGLISALQERTDRRAFVTESELARLLKTAGREGSTLSAIVREAWDSGTLRVTTRKDPLAVTGAHVTVIGNITTEELRRNLTDIEAVNGFANRFLWVCARRTQLLPEGGEIPQDDFDRFSRLIRKRLEDARQVTIIRRNDEARAYWATLYARMADSDLDGLAGAVTSRAEAQMLRLSVAYALTDASRTVTVQHLEAAWAVWRYVEQSARYIFGSSLGLPVADRLLDALRAAGADGLDGRQQSELFARHATKDDLDLARKLLQSRGLAKNHDVSTGGRPRRVLIACEVSEQRHDTRETPNPTPHLGPCEQSERANKH